MVAVVLGDAITANANPVHTPCRCMCSSICGCFPIATVIFIHEYYWHQGGRCTQYRVNLHTHAPREPLQDTRRKQPSIEIRLRAEIPLARLPTSHVSHHLVHEAQVIQRIQDRVAIADQLRFP